MIVESVFRVRVASSPFGIRNTTRAECPPRGVSHTVTKYNHSDTALAHSETQEILVELATFDVIVIGSGSGLEVSPDVACEAIRPSNILYAGYGHQHVDPVHRLPPGRRE